MYATSASHKAVHDQYVSVVLPLSRDMAKRFAEISEHSMSVNNIEVSSATTISLGLLAEARLAMSAFALVRKRKSCETDPGYSVESNIA